MYINDSLHLASKYARIIVRGHVPRSEQFSVSFEEQVMSKDKFPSIFSRQMEAIWFIILQTFFATRAIIVLRYSLVLAGEYYVT